MNNDNIFYELREQNADTNINDNSKVNGDFTTKLKKPITLEYGDQLLLNKAILDTRSLSSGKILLENETEFKVYFSPYQRDIDNTGKFTDEARTSAKTTNTNSLYFPLIPYRGGEDVWEITEFRLNSDQGKYPSQEGWTMSFEYINLEGRKTTAHYPSTIQVFPDPIIPGFTDSRWTTGPISILALNPNNYTDINKIFVNATSADLMTKFKITTAEAVGSNLGNASSHYSHMELGISATLPAGNYTPQDFSDRLTRLFTKNGSNTINTKYSQQNGGSDNNLLNSSIGNNLTAYHPDNPMIDELGEKYFYLSNGSSASWVGTNQFSLGFDVDTNKFEWSYTHFPLYDSNGNEIVEYVSVGSDIEIRNSYGGVIIRELKSIDKVSGEELNLWSNVLGFDLHNICPPTLNRQQTALNATVPFFKNLQYGKEITGGEIGIDIAVIKSNFKFPATLPPSAPTIISNTIPIYADNDFSTVNINFGYFIVQIQGLSSDMITYDDIKNSMMSVISRYYSRDNYTFGSPEDAIIYTHRGTTQYLNSFRVRILDSNYNLAGELGNDSTIFLQHRKGRMPLDMIEMKEEKK